MDMHAAHMYLMYMRATDAIYMLLGTRTARDSRLFGPARQRPAR